jgi:hypothetical protein
MTNTSASLQLSIAAGFFLVVAAVSLVKFRKKVKLIRSLSDSRELDVYVPYNMLIYGFSCLNYNRQTGMAFPFDGKNAAVLQELKKSWVVSLSMVLSVWFAVGISFLTLVAYNHQ